MSGEEAPPDPLDGQVAPGDRAGADRTSPWGGEATIAADVADGSPADGSVSDGVEAVPPAPRPEPVARLGSPYEGTSAAAPYQRPAGTPAAGGGPALGERGAGDVGEGDVGQGSSGTGSAAAQLVSASRSAGQEGPGAARPTASLFEPIPVSDAGYVIDRPDVSQAVCTDHDARRINLTALRPVAAAHPFPLVFSSVSGAHLYGFPSADSDVDLRGVHVLPVNQVVGLRHGPQTVERTWLHDEVKLDLVTYDVGKFFRLMLRRNGHVLEQLLSPLVVTSSPVHEELIAIAGGCLTRGHAHHYRGFAQEQWELYQQTGQLKPLLYMFRVLLTGIHVIRTGELVAHLPSLVELVPGAPDYLPELIEAKSTAEQDFAPELPERVGDDMVTLQTELDLAEDDSPLPHHPVAEGALHDLLVQLRLEGTAAWHA